MEKLNVLDLFSGIGGFSLGLERAGMRTVAFCEIEPFCQAVLRKHWPDIPIYHDIRTLTAERLAADGIGPIDVICGGFPCQDISVAGKGAGIEGERSGLWQEYARLIGELRPQGVIVENVAALLGRGMGRVLGDLAEIGCDAEWHCISASDVGAPHIRDRVWIIANPNSEWQPQQKRRKQNEWRRFYNSPQASAADAWRERIQRSITETVQGGAHFRGAKMSEGLRTTFADPTFLNPCFAELVMGYPPEWTLLETPLSRKSQKSLAKQSSAQKGKGNANEH